MEELKQNMIHEMSDTKHIILSKKDNSIETESRSVVSWSWVGATLYLLEIDF